MQIKDLQPVAETPISPSPKTWETFIPALPFALFGAILWVAALLAARYGVGQLLTAIYGKAWHDENGLIADSVVWTLFTLALLIWTRAYRRKPLWTLGLSLRRLPGDLAFTVVAAVVMGVFYLILLGGVFLYFGIAAETPVEAFQDFLRSAMFSRRDVLFLLAVIVFYPVVEEVWYRGVLYPPLRREFGMKAAIVFGALLFAFSHATLFPINQFIGGLAFGIAYEMRRTLVAPILLHIAGNGTLAAMAWLLPKLGWL